MTTTQPTSQAQDADNTASIKSGAILQGTGSDTGILMIAA